MRFRFALLTGGVVSLLLGLPTRTQAAGLLINVQFQDNSSTTPPPYNGAAVIGSPGDTWKPLFGFNQSGTPLIDTAAFPTSVTFSNSADPMGMTVSGTSTSDPIDTAFPSPLDNLMNSYVYSDANAWFPNTFSFSGLTPGSAYDLYIYSQGNSSSSGRQLTVSINGTTQTTNPSDETASTFILNQNYLFFDDILADSTGTIQADWYSANIFEANINGFQLRQSSAPPVPGPLPLLGAAAAFRVSRRLRARINRPFPVNNQPPA